jgi:sulfur-oxidizing protein SoxY
MNQSRRDAMRIASVLGLAVAAGIIKPGQAFAAEWNANAFNAKTLQEAEKALGAAGLTQSKEVVLTGPDIAENGAVVPVALASTLAKTEYMAILVEKNPQPLAAAFTVLEGTDPAMTTRIKMGTTSNVVALVKADGKWYTASKEIKVTLGGCGG